MKVAFVTPRYGEEIVGGAEHAARMLAEHLAVETDWNVEAWSSCATDATDWANRLPEGESELNGVTVRRFPTNEGRHAGFLHLSQQVHRRPRFTSLTLQNQWIDQQGPLVPGLVEALPRSDADAAVFYPYLYYPTVRGIEAVAGSRMASVLHPAAHDEVPIRMSVFGPVFGQVDGLVFQTDGERRLVEGLFEVAAKPQLTLGLGFDAVDRDDEAVSDFRKHVGLGDRPFIFCMGRVDPGKGSTLLAKFFAEYKRRSPGPLALVFSGPVVYELEESHPDIFVTGIVSESHKWAALHDCEVFISPSPFEAFSIALVEGWAAGKPAMVNAACIATSEHVKRSGGGIAFDGYLKFETSLSQLLLNRELAAGLGNKGRQYVTQNFSWPALIDRYAEFLESVVAKKQRL